IHAGPDRFGLTLPGLDDVADEEGTRSA
ncbi:MAG: hypothetical protein RI885_864, partial [Actinomycetota bacterium]